MADEDSAVFLECHQRMAGARKLESEWRLGKHGVMKKSSGTDEWCVFWD
ncbi:MAG: hypothetical protein ABIT37_01365 [Luteolibacter sp.]